MTIADLDTFPLPAAAFPPAHDFAAAVARGLSRRPRSIPSRFLYDARGSELYELITQQPEYYLTRTEAAIIERHAHRIAAAAGQTTLVEFGSGSSTKTVRLLAEWLLRDPPTYVPIDVSSAALAAAAGKLARIFPRLDVVPTVGDYRDLIASLPRLSPFTLAYLGSSIGNFDDAECDAFLAAVAAVLSSVDTFLLGIDLVKHSAILDAAYNDRAGVTAAFTVNLFDRMNREFGAGLDLAAIRHRARYAARRERVEIDAVFTARQVLRLPTGRGVVLREGEAIRTEISRKYRLDTFLPRLERLGLRPREIFTDERGWFALLLLETRRSPRQ